MPRCQLRRARDHSVSGTPPTCSTERTRVSFDLHDDVCQDLVGATRRESQQALGGLRPPDAASIGRWRAHKERLAGQLRIHGPITRELIELGYERDDAWLD